MTNFGDVDQVSRKLISANATIFLLAVYSLCAALDVANLIGVATYPQAVARFACSIRPLSLIAVPNVSGLPPQYIADQCLGDAREPAISIIFFSIKLTMAVCALIILWGFVFWRPGGLWVVKASYWQRFEVLGGYRKELGVFCRTSLGIMFFLFCCLLLASLGASEPSLRFAVALKFIVEDGLAVAIPAMALDFTVKASLFVWFALSNRKSMLGKDE